jgi:hypothetical protein
MEHNDPSRKLYIGDLTPSKKNIVMDIAQKHDPNVILKYNYNNGMPFGFLIIMGDVDTCTNIYNELYQNWIKVQRPKAYVEPVVSKNSEFTNYSSTIIKPRVPEITNEQIEYDRQIQLILNECY